MRIPDDPDHVLRRLLLRQIQTEPILQPSDRAFPFEARQGGLQHEPDGVDELVAVGSDGKERLDGEVLEKPVAV